MEVEVELLPSRTVAFESIIVAFLRLVENPAGDARLISFADPQELNSEKQKFKTIESALRLGCSVPNQSS